MTLSAFAQIPVFIINLDSSPERYQHAEQQLQALGISAQRFRGVYGKDLSATEVDACYDKTANHLAEQFVKNFEQYAGETSENILAAAPKVTV